MKPQSSDSYHPSERGVHSKSWMRGGDGSMVEGRVDGGEGWERRVRTVCRARDGSQVSICKVMLAIDSGCKARQTKRPTH